MRIQDARVEPDLPQPSPAAQPAVEILGVLSGDVLHQAAHAAFFLPRHHQMNVIRHQRMAMPENATVIGMVVRENWFRSSSVKKTGCR